MNNDIHNLEREENNTDNGTHKCDGMPDEIYNLLYKRRGVTWNWYIQGVDAHTGRTNLTLYDGIYCKYCGQLLDHTELAESQRYKSGHYLVREAELIDGELTVVERSGGRWYFTSNRSYQDDDEENGFSSLYPEWEVVCELDLEKFAKSKRSKL